VASIVCNRPEENQVLNWGAAPCCNALCLNSPFRAVPFFDSLLFRPNANNKAIGDPMERTPLFYHRKNKCNYNDLFRNYRCPGYDICLDQAAREDLFLDCTACLFKDDAVEEITFCLKPPE
jgi:hypothetical protein